MAKPEWYWASCRSRRGLLEAAMRVEEGSWPSTLRRGSKEPA